jgi:SWIM/SEC-C metal-binding protein
MARLGTRKKPAVVHVQTPERAHDVLEFCQANDLVVIVGIEPDIAEDITDIERALTPPEPVRAAPKVGRNDVCICGSGKKFKRCCAGQLAQSPA